MKSGPVNTTWVVSNGWHPYLLIKGLNFVLCPVLGLLLANPNASLAAEVSEGRPGTNIVAEVKSACEKRASEDKFSGAVLIAKAGKPIFQAAYGYADRDARIANSLDTKFRFGSMGKMFSGVAVLQLVQAGKIKLEAAISSYLPEYPNKEVAGVTVYELLTHTGGTGGHFQSRIRSPSSGIEGTQGLRGALR
jgi:CubicO group peptidase (beta-lactamase class C family)